MEYIDGGYVLTNRISDTNLIEMRNNMDDSDIEEFDKFVEENWHLKIKDGYAGVETIEEETKPKTTKKATKKQAKVTKK